VPSIQEHDRRRDKATMGGYELALTDLIATLKDTKISKE
jgi:hypothetical protein